MAWTASSSTGALVAAGSLQPEFIPLNLYPCNWDSAPLTGTVLGNASRSRTLSWIVSCWRIVVWNPFDIKTMASFVNTKEGIWKLILKKHTHTHITMIPALGTIIISKQANSITENQTKERERRGRRRRRKWWNLEIEEERGTRSWDNDLICCRSDNALKSHTELQRGVVAQDLQYQNRNEFKINLSWMGRRDLDDDSARASNKRMLVT
jgi:hypothetical protein